MSTRIEKCALCGGSGYCDILLVAMRHHGVADTAHESMRDTTCKCCDGSGVVAMDGNRRADRQPSLEDGYNGSHERQD